MNFYEDYLDNSSDNESEESCFEEGSKKSFLSKKSVSETESQNDSTACSHSKTIYSDNNEVCAYCNVVLDNNVSSGMAWKLRNAPNSVIESGRCHRSKGNDRTIYKDTENLEIPSVIINAANSKYEKIIQDQIRRGAKRRSIIAACIFYAYLEANEAKPMPEICKLLNIKPKAVKEGLKSYSEHFPDSSFQYIMPKHLVKEIMAKVKIEYSHYSNIQKLCSNLENKSDVLNSSKPQSVAASIVYLYLCTIPNYKTKLGLTKINFSNIVDLSENTITKLAKEAKKVLKLDVEL